MKIILSVLLLAEDNFIAHTQVAFFSIEDYKFTSRLTFWAEKIPARRPKRVCAKTAAL